MGVSYMPTVLTGSQHYIKERNFSLTDSIGKGTLVAAEATA